MTTGELQRLIAELPAGRELVVLIVRSTPMTAEPAAAGAALVAPAIATSEATCTARSDDHRSAPSPRRSSRSPLDLAEQVCRETPDTKLSAVAWHHRLEKSISVRELRRAIDAEAIKWGVRGSGRGHAAKVISPPSMVAYLTVRERVLCDSESAPPWFHRVVRRGNREDD